MNSMRLFILLAFILPSLFASPVLTDDILKPLQSKTDMIIEEALQRGQAYNRLQTMCDTFGNRFSGSKRLESAIDWIVGEMNKDGISVRTEPVPLPATWNRGVEWARLVSPQNNSKVLSILGLGFSIGTGGKPLNGKVVVVTDFEDLKRKCSQAKGNIVVFNPPYSSYADGSNYRQTGSQEAAKCGAIASLIRSVASFSLNTPHTGMGVPGLDPSPIPTASVTVEDAELLERLQNKGFPIEIQLYMEAAMGPASASRNVIAEIKGTQYPDEMVVFGGHIDSWDVGQGSLDDGGGAMISWEILRIVSKLGIPPKRTLRAVLFTDEEVTFMGSNTYFEKHKNELSNIAMAMETDEGIFNPIALGFNGSKEALNIMKKIGSNLLAKLGSGNVTEGYEGEDIAALCTTNIPVPCGSLIVEGSSGTAPLTPSNRYFYYHHTQADTMNAIDPHNAARAAASWAVWAYAVADLPFRLPSVAVPKSKSEL